MRYIVIVLLLAANTAYARPVSYPEGKTIMQMNNALENRLHLHYSPTFKHSLGVYYSYLREPEQNVLGLQWNSLIKRFNTKGSQTNIHTKLYTGYNFADKNLEASAAITADYETRNFYSSYEAKAKLVSLGSREFEQTARLGIAPYLGEYEDIHTWLMVEAKHQPQAKDNFIITPFVRLFYQDYLAEFGIDENKKIMLNWVVRR